MMRKVFLFLLVSFLYVSCGPKLTPEEERVHAAEKELNLQPSPEKANAYIDALSSYIATQRDKPQAMLPYLEKGITVAKEQGILHRAPGFIMPYLRYSEDAARRLAYLIDLGDIMYALNKRHASNVIYRQLLMSYPDDATVQKKRPFIDSTAMASANYVQYLFDQVIVNPDEYGINRQAAMKFIDGTEAYALVAPQNKDVPEYLYRGAEAARSMRDFGKAMSLYDWILDDYGDHERAPTVLFIKGFILEQEFDQPDEARKIYEEFIARYPDDQMVKSAEFLLDNLGKSDEEILQNLGGGQVQEPN